ncbi:MAG TPA: UbiH/UbiF/VisC/COQ6 family ubiquinone biosynthesis hydroxylase [Stellaceae bacterium]|nr:UbiH/UbiF/VisC/COQ6 family ubiquinone biosynthesis hydroxylase [Stellaceae bacterium]
MQSELVIVGGGMVGLSLATACAGAGLDVAVIDREAPSRMVETAFDGRTSAIAFGSQRILAGIGVWDYIAREAEPIHEIRVADGDSPLFLHYDHNEIGPDPLGYIVENRVLRRALLARAASLPNLRHLAPADVATAERRSGGVTVTLTDGASISGALLIAADGKLSPLREAAGIRTLEWHYKQTAIVCTVWHERPHLGIAIEHFLPAGPFAILPMTGDRSSIVWTERSELVPRLLALDATDFHAELARRFGDFLGRLEVVGPRWSYKLLLMHAARYGAERLILAGDAAHVIHPIAGQGLNLGLRDVAVLAELIVDARRLGLDIGAADILGHYERWRRFDTMALAAVTDGLNRLFSNDFPPLAWMRDLGLAAVNRLPPLRRFFMQHAMGMVGTLPRLVRGKRL